VEVVGFTETLVPPLQKRTFTPRRLILILTATRTLKCHLYLTKVKHVTLMQIPHVTVRFMAIVNEQLELGMCLCLDRS
jgi:hypothetical protein